MEQVQAIVDGLLQQYPDLFLVEVELKGQRGNRRLIVTLDGDRGVQIDQCAEISRALSQQIDELDLIDDKFHLEVSSAGMSRPLKLERQYRRHVGKRVTVKTVEGEEFEGLLQEVGDRLKLEVNEEVRDIPFEQIEKTTLVISF